MCVILAKETKHVKLPLPCNLQGLNPRSKVKSHLRSLAMKTAFAVVIGIWSSLGAAITIDTKLGQIEGVSTSNSIHQFLNIPYAEPPGTPHHVSFFNMLSFDFVLITITVSTQLMICDGEHQTHWQTPRGTERIKVQNGGLLVIIRLTR